MSVSEGIKKLNRNKIFKFVSSVRLAVPLMLILAVCVAYGTIVESNYNSEYAAMLIYKSSWFGALIVLLWLNIFSATISRIPFKIHHTGFVITHIGLLTLLIGGFVTNHQGIDGQLVIQEGHSSSTVVLPHLMIGYQLEGSPTPQMVKFSKTIHTLQDNDLASLNDTFGQLFKIKKYIPFAKIEKQYVESSDPNETNVALSFMLKSNFFDVSEWLHTTNNPQMSMGPATLKILKTDDLKKIPAFAQLEHPKKSKRAVNSENSDDTITIVSLSNENQSKLIKLKDLTKKTINSDGLSIRLIKRYDNAIVADNKVIEQSDGSGSNPAIELLIEKNGKKLREILYANFAGFSLNKDGIFGYKFSYQATARAGSQAGGATAIADENSQASTETPAQAAMGKGNTIIFSVNPNVPGKARVSLVKENKLVMSELLNEGQNLQTPWMGMKVFLGSVRTHAVEKMTAEMVNPEKSKQLPPSAILVSTGNTTQDDFWLSEGDQKQVQLLGKNAVVYFGRQTIELPFELKLKKFSKVDYPGTNTPLSFESLVEVGQTGVIQKISMNEPFKAQGFTVYQASYSLNPGETLSIFSVNQDPGRLLKYIGSLILGLGIITITLMRSRVWKNYLQRKNQHV